MKKVLLFVCVIFLAGCRHIPVKPEFPSIPPVFREECGKLSILKDNAKLSDLLITNTKNYMKFHECDQKNKAWLEWYDKQKKLYENIGK